MNDNSQLFAHQVYTVRRLANQYSKIIVITGKRDKKCKVPSNVKVFSINWVPNRNLRNSFFTYYYFFKTLINTKIDFVFSHMTDAQSALISPFTKLFGIPHVLWYAHVKKSFWLHLSNFFVDKIVTSTQGSCPINSPKVIAIGQAIDTDLFKFESKRIYRKTHLIHVGRIDPSKRIIELIKTFEILRSKNPKMTFKLIGYTSSKRFLEYQTKVEKISNSVGGIQLIGKVDRQLLPTFLSNNDIFIHMFEGSLDKVLVEATLLGLPVITINKEYLKTFGKWNFLSEISVVNEFEAFINLSQSEIIAECKRRYKLAFDLHSYNQWQNKLIEILEN